MFSFWQINKTGICSGCVVHQKIYSLTAIVIQPWTNYSHKKSRWDREFRRNTWSGKVRKEGSPYEMLAKREWRSKIIYILIVVTCSLLLWADNLFNVAGQWRYHYGYATLNCKLMNYTVNKKSPTFSSRWPMNNITDNCIVKISFRVTIPKHPRISGRTIGTLSKQYFNMIKHFYFWYAFPSL